MAQPEARQATHWGFWGTVVWGVAIFGVFVLLQIVTLIALAASGRMRVGGSFEELAAAAAANGTLLAYSSVVTGVVCTALILGVVKLRRGAVLAEYLRLRPVGMSTMAKWIAYTLVLVAIMDLVTVSIGRPIVPPFMSEAYGTAQPVWLFWIALLVAAPLFEETFFRGFLFRGLEASSPGPMGAVIVTAVLWAVIHVQYDAYEMTIIVCMGLLLGAARLKTQSLFVPLAMHATMNVIATVETVLQA